MTTAAHTGLGGFAGRTILAFESRRASEMAELIRRHGGEPFVAPSMREVPLDDDSVARELLRRLEAGEVDLTIFLTGVGLRALLSQLPGPDADVRLAAALRRCTVAARGPKPVAVLKELQRPADLVAPEPNTWRELLATLDAHVALDDKLVAVQEYGVGNDALLDALAQRGARLLRVPVYRWELPEDVRPLERAIAMIAEGEAVAVLFTSANQVYSLFQVAADRSEAVRAGLARMVVASVGPICSEALAAHGIEVRYEPPHPKMGQLVGGLARALDGLLLEVP